MKLRSLRLLALGLLCLAPSFASAANDLQLELIAKALRGQSKPGLVVFANKAVASVEAKIQGPEGRRHTLRSGRIPAGGKHELLFDAPVGRSQWTGTLEVTFSDETSGSMPLSFEVLVSAGVSIITPQKSDIDARAGTMKIVLDGGDADKCEYEVAFDGKQRRRGWARFKGEPAGTPLTVSWAPHGEDDVILRIRLTCHDTESFFSPTLEVYPWEAPVAHDDVVFDSGSHVILPHEQPKLDAAYEAIAEGIRRYGKVLEKEIKLYVAGHTDTVGDSASNRALSQRRARAIAEYFRKKGVRVPIHYVGFGEERPLVSTPDNTDEPRNRRAEYIISVNPPIPASWSKL